MCPYARVDARWVLARGVVDSDSGGLHHVIERVLVRAKGGVVAHTGGGFWHTIEGAVIRDEGGLWHVTENGGNM